MIGRPSKQRRVVLRRRNTVVGGKCALPSALLVLVRTDEIFLIIKVGRLVPASIRNITAVAFPVKPETQRRRLAELKQTVIVEWRKLDHSIVVTATSQWRRRLSACVWAHSGLFEHIFVMDSWLNVLT